MKRLVWLLVLAFGTAFAQVSPVDVRVIPTESCGCCETPGACGMPDCGPAPVSAQPVSSPSCPVRISRLDTRRGAPAPHAVREKFYVQFLPPVSVRPVLPVTLAAAPPASVPLFQAHCRLLI